MSQPRDYVPPQVSHAGLALDMAGDNPQEEPRRRGERGNPNHRQHPAGGTNGKKATQEDWKRCSATQRGSERQTKGTIAEHSKAHEAGWEQDGPRPIENIYPGNPEHELWILPTPSCLTY